jgi:hypothetical protein
MLQLCEAININVLFPFLAFMVEHFGYTGHRLGYYAGILAGSFCAAQLTSSMLWGVVSDTYGRKPAVIIGALGAGVGMLVFGSATSFEQAVLGRALSGFLSGNIGVIKSFLTEITDHSNRPKGYSFLQVAWASGSIMGPLLGGYLCYPADKLPGFVAKDGIFGDTRPFLLPTLLCAALNFLAGGIAIFFMEETLNKHRGAAGDVTLVMKNGAAAGVASEGNRGLELRVLASDQDASSRISSGIDKDSRNHRATGLSDIDDADMQLNSAMQPMVVKADLPGKDDASTVASRSFPSRSPRSVAVSPSSASAGGRRKGTHSGYSELDSSEHGGFDGYSEGLDNDDDDEFGLDDSSGKFLSGDADISEFAENYRKSKTSSPSTTTTATAPAVTGGGNSTLSVLRDPTVMRVLLCYGILCFGDVVTVECIPLLCKLDIEMGGLSMSSADIGTAISCGGVFMLFFSLLFLPKIMSGSKLAVFRWCNAIGIPLVLIFPLLGTLSKYLVENASSLKAAHRWLMVLLVIASTVRTLVFTLTFTAVSRFSSFYSYAVLCHYVVYLDVSVIGYHAGEPLGR